MSELLSNDERKRLYSLFNKTIDEKPIEPSKRTLNSEILIVDFMNTFLRAYSANPSLDNNGNHTGGISGCLKSIGYAAKLLNPTRIIIVSDGAGGSLKRRKIYPDYKKGRRNKIRLNRAYEDMSDESTEDKSLKIQLLKTIKYLDVLPVTTMAIDNIEADDAIAYLSVEYFKNSNVTIMSSDKDFLQLACDHIKIWSPTKKKIYGCAEILMEYGISCGNYINYRIMEGDVSDNIDGIGGAGLKTILKCFPIFADQHRYSLDEIYNYSENYKGKYKLYDTILNNKNIMSRNLQLMQLHETCIQSFTQLRINEIVEKPLKKLDRYNFGKMLLEDNMKNNFPDSFIWLNEVFGKVNSFVS
jgi:DNA polymerase I